MADGQPDPKDDPRYRVAVKDPEHLKRFLAESGRKYLVFNALDLVDALQFPGDLQVLQQFIELYRHRRAATRQTGWERTETVRTEFTSTEVTVKVVAGEHLEPAEVLECIRQLHDGEQDLLRRRQQDLGARRSG